MIAVPETAEQTMTRSVPDPADDDADPHPATPPLAPRRVIRLRGPAAAVRARAAALLPPSPRVPWIAGDGRAPHAAKFLGRSFDGAVIDTFDGLDANRFGALAGALVSGAPLLWLAPDPATAAAQPPRSPFLARCDRLLDAEPRVRDVGPDDPVELRAAESAGSALAGSALAGSAHAGSRPAAPQPASADQARAVRDLVRCLTGRARRPLVLIADRGRGKSAALGLAAAEALAARSGVLLVTAPDERAAAKVLGYGRARCAALGVDPSRLRFVPPDAVPDAAHGATGFRADARADPQATLGLLVDEAAALSVERLDAWLQGYPRIALATTVHGYEGSGRGFEQRLVPRLDARLPGWRRCVLRTPIRFPANDPLEALQFALLALDAELVAPAPEPATPVRSTAADLAQDERALRALFGLLVAAHYQTRPSDLQRLLDDPALRAWHTGPAHAPTACALAIDEGGLAPALAADLVAGRRRPPGHQGPGVLATRLGFTEGAQLASVRISRIAVHPDCRRQGLGSALIRTIADDARRRGCALLTSQFGATDPLLRFWSGSGLEPVRLGLTREVASGEHAAFVMQGLDDDGRALAARARARFGGEVIALLADALRDLPASLTLRLLRSAAPPEVSADDAEGTRRWLAGEVPLAERPGAVGRSLVRALQAAPDPSADLPPDQDPAALGALAARLFQQANPAALARALGVSGRGRLEARLRRALAALLGADPGS